MDGSCSEKGETATGGVCTSESGGVLKGRGDSLVELKLPSPGGEVKHDNDSGMSLRSTGDLCSGDLFNVETQSVISTSVSLPGVWEEASLSSLLGRVVVGELCLSSVFLPGVWEDANLSSSLGRVAVGELCLSSVFLPGVWKEANLSSLLGRIAVGELCLSSVFLPGVWEEANLSSLLGRVVVGELYLGCFLEEGNFEFLFLFEPDPSPLCSRDVPVGWTEQSLVREGLCSCEAS